MLNLRTLADDARIEITGRDLKALYNLSRQLSSGVGVSYALLKEKAEEIDNLVSRAEVCVPDQVLEEDESQGMTLREWALRASYPPPYEDRVLSLMASQLHYWPDSRIMTLSEVYHEWMDPDRTGSVARQIAMALQYPGVVFYECGENLEFAGFRFGAQPYEYAAIYRGTEA